MQISFSPVRRDGGMTLLRQGDALLIDGVAYDFADVVDGAILPRDAVAGDWLMGDVTRTDGVLSLRVALPHGPDAADAHRFPAPITLEDGDSFEAST